MHRRSSISHALATATRRKHNGRAISHAFVTRPLLLAHPPTPPSPLAGVITLFEFCHHVFPDLDVERLAKEGLIDLDTHGTPRLLSDAESNSFKIALSREVTGSL